MIENDDQIIERLRRSFDAQKDEIRINPVPSYEQRIERISLLKTMLKEYREAFHQSIAEDFSVIHPRMVDMTETGPVLARIEYFSKQLNEWMRPKRIDTGERHGSSYAEIINTPKGVCGNISPWNFPIECALVMVVDMFAAGNTVILKLSELAPATSKMLEKAIAQFFDPKILTAVSGGIKVSKCFSQLPWDHLTFTGSPGVGRLIAQEAAKNLVPTTLELGGKNPAIFAEDGINADLIDVFLKFRALKSGQVCTSPDYVMVPNDRLEDWLELVAERWSLIYPRAIGHPFTTGMINDQQYQRVLGYISEAKAHGVRVISLNNEQADPLNRQIPLTLIVEPELNSSCMQDEIFGPVVPILTYQTIDEVIQYLNNQEVPLASYLATYDDDLADKFALNVRSGGCGINTFGSQAGHVELPFGGFGQSGSGCHSGKEGFLNYTHTKSVLYAASDSLVHKVIGPQPSDSE